MPSNSRPCDLGHQGGSAFMGERRGYRKLTTDIMVSRDKVYDSAQVVWESLERSQKGV